MTAPSVQTAGNTIGNAQGVFNQTQSKLGPKAVPVRVDLTVNTAFTLDLATLNAFNTIDFVQTLFVDNSLNPAATYIYNGVSQQTLVVPAMAQAYLPFLCPNPGRFTVTSAGGVVVPIEMLNFPVSPAVWNSTSQAFSFDNQGNLKVTDKTLATVGVTGGALNVFPTGGSGGSTPEFDRFFNQLGGAGGTGTLTILTGAPRFLLHHAAIWISPFCYLRSGVPGIATVEIRDEANPICSIDIGLPGAPPAAGGLMTGTLYTFPNLDIKSDVDGNRLRINLSADVGTSSEGIAVTLTALPTAP